MKFRSALQVAAIALITCFAFSATSQTVSAAEWRWSKPLNQKPGSLLYTTNVSKYRSSSRSGWNRTQTVYRKSQYTPLRARRGFLFRR